MEKPEILPQCEERFASFAERDRRMDAKLDKICRAVVGPDGDPLTSRVTALESFRKGARWMLAILVALVALAGTVYAALQTIGN